MLIRAIELAFAIWAVTGIWFVIRSGSRGIVADVMFGALWPLYWYTDWRGGRWSASFSNAAQLLYPAFVVIAVASLAAMIG